MIIFILAIRLSGKSKEQLPEISNVFFLSLSVCQRLFHLIYIYYFPLSSRYINLRENFTIEIKKPIRNISSPNIRIRIFKMVSYTDGETCRILC